MPCLTYLQLLAQQIIKYFWHDPLSYWSCSIAQRFSACMAFYFSDRTKLVFFDDSTSSHKLLLHEVLLMKSNGFSFQLHVDDTQIYIASFPKDLDTSISKFQNCYIFNSNWPSGKLNGNYTHLVLKIQLKYPIKLGNSKTICIDHSSQNWSYFDEMLALSFETHTSNVWYSSFISLSNLSITSSQTFLLQKGDILVNAILPCSKYKNPS